MESKDLNKALRKARLAEAAHLDALQGVDDAKILRLQVLRDKLQPVVAATPEARDFIDLTLIPSVPPRLWIDLISSVIMSPDPRTYQLQQDNDGGRTTLFESEKLSVFSDYLTDYIAHRVLIRSKTMIRSQSVLSHREGYSVSALLYAWFTGLILGCVIVVILSIALGLLSF